MRKRAEEYPDYTSFVDVIAEEGISPTLLAKIIDKHRENRRFNLCLYDRYKGLDGAVPITRRQPRFNEKKPINNKIANDFFGEIVDFKTGYFAGSAISYSYSQTAEAKQVSNGEKGVELATKTLTDFIVRNNMYGLDLEVTKYASINGYAGRLFYVDVEGNERALALKAHETIILSKTRISEPQYAIRYYETEDINNVKSWVVEFYDDTYIHTYTGMLSNLKLESKVPHLFDYCPLQGVENNSELEGDAEKVLSEIDDYDKVISDNSNEIEAFAHAYMVFKNCSGIDGDTIAEGQKSGAFYIQESGTMSSDVSFLTKNINSTFTEQHLTRLEDNIYRFSKTPDLKDSSFGTSSGEALKFKLHGLETKCGIFEAMMMYAGAYMWKVLASAWRKKNIPVDPLQITMNFSRNFPLNTLSNAQSAQALISAGIPEMVAWDIAIPEIDDINYVKQLKAEEEKEAIEMFAGDRNDTERGVKATKEADRQSDGNEE